MASSPAPTTVRLDAWTWAVRLYPTRSAATAACRAGHVKVNGASAKPAHAIRIGDSVRARNTAGERSVVVTGLIGKRVSATVAVQNYEDRTPAPPPNDAGRPPAFRERGSGRPTKRDRRLGERLRGRG